MACAIDSSVGTPTANSYTAILEADAYHEAHVLGATWAAATDDQKCRALQTATRQIDANMDWLGVATYGTQVLAWPRVGMIYPETEMPIPQTEIPSRLKYAVAEQARELLAGDRAAELQQQAQGLEALEVGSVALKFRGDGASRPVICPAAMQFIVQWGRTTGIGGGTALLFRM